MKRLNDNTERGNIEIIGSLAVIVLLILIGVGCTIAWNSTRQAQVCSVESKVATTNKDGGNKYLIFTKNCGQLQVADSWTNGKFNATDTYAKIKEGTSYTFETVGWRNGLFSTYPNILEVTQ